MGKTGFSSTGVQRTRVADDPSTQAMPEETATPTPRRARGLQWQVWKSRLSWRITLTVFATILLVQSIVMVFTTRAFEAEELGALRRGAQTAVAIAIGDARDQLAAPLERREIDQLMSATSIRGIGIYALDHGLLTTAGDSTILRPAISSQALRTYRSSDGAYYEVLFQPDDIGRPYYVSARLDASHIKPAVIDHIKQTLVTLVLFSVFVTGVLMMVLGEWLLQPIIMLRNNLLSAARHPEKPDLAKPEHESRDEVGLTIRIANDLIRQNATNLKRLRSQAEDRIHKLAYYDALTNLPNRTYFLEKLDEMVRMRVLKDQGRIAVFSVDLDHFKDINDTMGHDFGDRLLEAVGRRLVKSLPGDALIARASADEFMAMVPLHGRDQSTDFVDAILAAMSEPISILQERFQVRVSIGIAQCPEDGVDARQIVKNADIALNRAKEEGRDTVRYYSQDFDHAVKQRFQLLRDLRIALDENQLRLHYHPQFDLATGRMVGVEALLRWWRPDNSREGGSFVPPYEFIPVAEQSGLIVPIGEWVLKTACAANKAWQDMGLPPFRMAVNISGIQFHRGDVIKQVESALGDSKLAAKYLELEVTESVFMENVQVAIDTLNKLHQMGCEIAVDDFGTGYSSLSYLRQFPIDRLKIDQSFVRNALVNEGDRMIARTIITLGHSLNLQVIAEGVETSDHEAFLREEGCDEVQGFKYSQPLSFDALTAFAREQFRLPASGAGRLTVVPPT